MNRESDGGKEEERRMVDIALTTARGAASILVKQ